MHNNINNEFLTEFKALLAKYNADISFSVGSCSDTHGLYDEKMVISRRLSPDNWKEEDIIEVSGWSISSRDIDI